MRLFGIDYPRLSVLPRDLEVIEAHPFEDSSPAATDSDGDPINYYVIGAYGAVPSWLQFTFPPASTDIVRKGTPEGPEY